MLRCIALTKTYRSGGRDLTVLNDITFSVEPGGFAAIVGPSGSGKTTLLGLLAGLDRPTAGTVHLDGQELGALDEDARARMRGEKIGFVFQSFQLIPTLTARENIQVPLELRGEEAGERAADLLQRVGLGDRGHHYPAQLSGGEQQRTAIARALVHDPRLIIADEPTGNLDPLISWEILQLLLRINELGVTVLMATHNAEVVTALRKRVVALEEGRVIRDEVGGAYHRED
jgi:putative ABC transport system ATP-binding protein